jgi:hypothetical protein
MSTQVDIRLQEWIVGVDPRSGPPIRSQEWTQKEKQLECWKELLRGASVLAS